MKQKRNSIIAIIIAVYLIIITSLLFFRKNEAPIYKISPVKKIETRVQGKEKIIKTVEYRIGNEKRIIQQINLQVDSLRMELQNLKLAKDTFRIVRIQDTLIYTLTDENNRLKSIITGQDSIIVAQRYIINSKDTLINLSRRDTKKIKRQRNLSIGLNAVLLAVGGVAIIVK